METAYPERYLAGPVPFLSAGSLRALWYCSGRDESGRTIRTGSGQRPSCSLQLGYAALCAAVDGSPDLELCRKYPFQPSDAHEPRFPAQSPAAGHHHAGKYPFYRAAFSHPCLRMSLFAPALSQATSGRNRMAHTSCTKLQSADDDCRLFVVCRHSDPVCRQYTDGPAITRRPFHAQRLSGA